MQVPYKRLWKTEKYIYQQELVQSKPWSHAQFPSSLNKKFCLFSVTQKKLSKVIWSLLVPRRVESLTWRGRLWRGIQCGKNPDNKVTRSDHRSTFRLETVSFMWVTCPARFSGRRQQGTMVRLGSCWQTIPGPSAISSCFLSTKALTGSGLYLFIPLL